MDKDTDVAGLGQKLTQMAQDAVNVSGNVYGSSGVGENRKKGYTSVHQISACDMVRRQSQTYGCWGRNEES